MVEELSFQRTSLPPLSSLRSPEPLHPLVSLRGTKGRFFRPHRRTSLQSKEASQTSIQDRGHGPNMPSDFLTPFLEVDEEFSKTFRGLDVSDGLPMGSQQHRVLGFRRRHSLCPVTLPNSKFNSGGSEAAAAAAAGGLRPWGLRPWSRELPRSSLSHIPFRVDRSVSMIEGNVCSPDSTEGSPAVLLPPPGLCISSASLSSPAGPAPSAPHISTRYKTELCRTYEESGACKYGAKCQFAHGLDELRGLSRHPKYKTEPCRTFHTIGFCPYGARCHFIHNAEEMHACVRAQRPKARPPLLRHSLSFAGFSSSPSFQPLEKPGASSLLLSRASSVSPPASSMGSPEVLSPGFPEPGPLKHCLYPLDHVADAGLRFYAASDCVPAQRPGSHLHFSPQLPAPVSSLSGLQRCSSADSLSEEGYTSSCSLSSSSSGTESPSFEARRLPIFSRLSVTDE
ncbi:mRNA decay activator protein ZFP36L1 [Betta splendens]|uniref:mRNA decay activator protein ZFP36 n=1 Tax=Betta splendens TaxID=158456 RepID=A0A6P7PC72_BETSP|nr:mRNA decay activator protein ZFP36L1 [Betta splendens]